MMYYNNQCCLITSNKYKITCINSASPIQTFSVDFLGQLQDNVYKFTMPVCFKMQDNVYKFTISVCFKIQDNVYKFTMPVCFKMQDNVFKFCSPVLADSICQIYDKRVYIHHLYLI